VGVTASGDGGAALLGVTELGEAGLGLAELSVVGLFVADVTAGEGVGASRGAGTGAELAAVDEGAAGADVTAESLVVGATGSGVRVEGGASTLDGAEGATTTGASVVGTAAAGAFSTEDGATDGTSAGLDFSAGARVAAGGSGSTVVDGAPGEPGEPGAAKRRSDATRQRGQRDDHPGRQNGTDRSIATNLQRCTHRASPPSDSPPTLLTDPTAAQWTIG
jgi:hypothetical protein